MAIPRANENKTNYNFKTFSSDSQEGAQATGESSSTEDRTNYHDHELIMAILEKIPEPSWDQDTRHFVLDVAEDLFCIKRDYCFKLDKEEILSSSSDQENFIRKIIANGLGHNVSRIDAPQLKTLV